MTHSSVLEQMRRRITPELYEEIRDLWKQHSIAEEARDIAGLMATLAEDCVYELPQTGNRWEGHEGATQFYVSLLTAFPDVRFDLQHIVIGPQGVFEEAYVTGTHKDQWLDRAPTDEPVTFQVLIHFPWDAKRRKFKGERVYFFWDAAS